MRTSLTERRTCAGPDEPLVGEVGLVDLDEGGRVDRDHVAALLGSLERLDERDDAAVFHRARLQELDLGRALDRRGGRRAAGSGRVAVGAVKQLEPAAVRIHRIQVYRAAARILPAAEHDAPVVEHVGVEVVTLVEGDLADAGAVRRSSRAARRRARSGPRPGRRTAACPRRSAPPSTGAGGWRRRRCGRPAGSAARCRGLPRRRCRRR